MQQFVAWAHADIVYKIKTKNTKKKCLSSWLKLISQQGREEGNGHRNMSQQAKVKDSAKIRGVISCLTAERKKKWIYKQVENNEVKFAFHQNGDWKKCFQNDDTATGGKPPRRLHKRRLKLISVRPLLNVISLPTLHSKKRPAASSVAAWVIRVARIHSPNYFNVKVFVD